MKLFVVMCAGLLAVAPAAAQTMNGGASGSGSGAELSERGDGPVSTGERGVGADGERRICRRIEVTSSSRMTSRRVCRTAEEWRQTQRGG